MNQIIKLSALLALFLLPGCGGTLVDLEKKTFHKAKSIKVIKKRQSIIYAK